MLRSLSVIALAASTSLAYAETEHPKARPDTPSVGVGAGMSVPGSALTLDTGSVRLRLADSFTLEPAIGFEKATGEATVEYDTDDSTSEYSQQDISVEANGRINVATRGSADLEGVLGVGYSSTKYEYNPDGADNDQTTSSSQMFVNVGFGVVAWGGVHWSVSADALARLFYQAKGDTEDESSDLTTESKSSSFALPLDPTVRLMVHLYL